MISGSSSADTRTHTPPLAQLPISNQGQKPNPGSAASFRIAVPLLSGFIQYLSLVFFFLHLLSLLSLVYRQ